MPSLSIFAPVVAGVFVGGPASPLAPAPTFPASLAAFAGFPAGLALQAAAGVGGGWVGYTMGPAPAGMSFSTVAGVANQTQMAARWTPCPHDEVRV